MVAPGTVWAGMLGLQFSRFDRLLVYDPVDTIYKGGLGTLRNMPNEIDQLQILDTGRLDAIEAKLASLNEQIQQKATNFVAIDPLSLDEGTFPHQLSQQGGPTPQSASAINLNGETAYIQFEGRTHVLDYTKDWTVGCSMQTQGEGVEASNMTAFHVVALH